MSRVVMATRIKAERLEDYIAMHRDPDHAVAHFLKRFGHHDYHLHLVGDLAVASFDYSGTDLETDRQMLRQQPRLAEWMHRTSVCQKSLSQDPGAPVWLRLPLIFPVTRTDDQ